MPMQDTEGKDVTNEPKTITGKIKSSWNNSSKTKKVIIGIIVVAFILAIIQ